MAEPNTASQPEPDEHDAPGGHVVPWTALLLTCLALLALTWLTVAATYVNFGGSINLWIALVIATIKASLVVMFFMHLKYDRPFNAFVFIASLAFVALFLGLALTDSVAYHNELIPPTDKNYAPARQRVQMDTTTEASAVPETTPLSESS